MESHNYTKDIESILENIRVNSVLLHKEHQKRYLQLKDTLKYYKIPIIVISSISSIVSMSQQYLDQDIITILNMCMGLCCSIIGSIELFFGIASQMIAELDVSREYHILAMDIFKCLSLKPENRSSEGRTYLEHTYATYIKLVEKSHVVRKKIEDRLCMIPKDIPKFTEDGSRSSSLDSIPKVLV